MAQLVCRKQAEELLLRKYHRAQMADDSTALWVRGVPPLLKRGTPPSHVEMSGHGCATWHEKYFPASEKYFPGSLKDLPT